MEIQKRIHSNCAINQQQSCILFIKIGVDEIFQYALRSQARLRDRTTSLADHRKAIFGGNKRPYRIMIEEATQSKVNTIIELDDRQKVQWIAVRGSDNLNIPRQL